MYEKIGDGDLRYVSHEIDTFTVHTNFHWKALFRDQGRPFVVRRYVDQFWLSELLRTDGNMFVVRCQRCRASYSQEYDARGQEVVLVRRRNRRGQFSKARREGGAARERLLTIEDDRGWCPTCDVICQIESERNQKKDLRMTKAAIRELTAAVRQVAKLRSREQVGQ
jgi:hypothetical protein